MAELKQFVTQNLREIVADYKVPDGSSFNAVRGAVYDADSQMLTHMVYYPRIHDYSLQECLKEIKKKTS